MTIVDHVFSCLSSILVINAFYSLLKILWGFPGCAVVKNPPAKAGDSEVRFLGREDLLEKEMTAQCIILAWEIPWTEKPDSLQSMGSQKGWPPLSD